MNKDFHYYGTYSAARYAGFDHEEASVIAWAAETVDESHLSNIMKTKTYLNNSVMRYVGQASPIIVTVESLTDNIVDFWHNGVNQIDVTKLQLWDTDWPSIFRSKDEYTYAIQKMRYCWMPFHFLPGNFEKANPVGGIKTINNKGIESSFTRTFTTYDNREMQLLCRNNSESTRLIVENAKYYYDNNIYNDKNSALIAIGVVMHVLADTWAHEYFTGSSNFYINSATCFRIPERAMERIEIKPDEIEEFFSGTPSAGIFTDTSALFLGHGNAGHCPDYDFLEYEYTPGWMKDGEEFGEFTTVCNPERFSKAFAQMINAMRYIQGKEVSFELVPNGAKEYDSYVEKVKNAIFLKPCNKSDFDEVLDNRCNLWKYYIKGEWGTSVVDYTFNGGDSTEGKLQKFWEFAKTHRAAVLNYINQNVGGFYSEEKIEKEIDQWIYYDFSDKIEDIEKIIVLFGGDKVIEYIL